MADCIASTLDTTMTSFYVRLGANTGHEHTHKWKQMIAHDVHCGVEGALMAWGLTSKLPGALQGVRVEREVRPVVKHDKTRMPTTPAEEAGSGRSDQLPAGRRNAGHGEARFSYVLL